MAGASHHARARAYADESGAPFVPSAFEERASSGHVDIGSRWADSQGYTRHLPSIEHVGQGLTTLVCRPSASGFYVYASVQLAWKDPVLRFIGELHCEPDTRLCRLMQSAKPDAILQDDTLSLLERDTAIGAKRGKAKKSKRKHAK